MDNQQPQLQEKLRLNTFIENVVFWIGTICAVISLFAYIIVVIVMVVGFIQEQRSLLQDMIFALVTGSVGVLIMQFMKVQGISFAKKEPDVKYWCDKWTTRRTKDRKYRSISFFWWTTAVKDVLFKLAIIIIASVGLVYVFIEASDDPMRILFALFNVVMFFGFGMHALSKAYTFYRTEHVEWIKVQLEDNIKAKDKLLVDSVHQIAIMLGTDYIERERQFVEDLHRYVLHLARNIPEVPASTEPGKGD